MRIESKDVLEKSIVSSQSLTGPVVSASACEPVGRDFYPGLCPNSVFAIVCNARLLQVRPMVTSRLALTCCKLVSHLHTCRDKFAESLQICSASLLQICCKLKLLSGKFCKELNVFIVFNPRNYKKYNSLLICRMRQERVKIVYEMNDYHYIFGVEYPAGISTSEFLQ
ncbi:hypothetical protein AVEN_127338-1 [Araneus ventricosus]|uniref:Uncharacterized protein n=1 Tax=Araneus ventricosus TaxID=182803 RepID=A0A4Y2HZB6_ARAVE|nr:hypothetical protein AVEN_127338-1 [Araneus ventricosus]